jgi:hypothetical protein
MEEEGELEGEEELDEEDERASFDKWSRYLSCKPVGFLKVLIAAFATLHTISNRRRAEELEEEELRSNLLIKR